MKLQRKGFSLSELKEKVYDYTPPPAKSQKYFKGLFKAQPPTELIRTSKYTERAANYQAKSKKYNIACHIQTPKDKPKTIQVKSTLTIDKVIKRFTQVSILCKTSNQRAYWINGKFEGVTHYED